MVVTFEELAKRYVVYTTCVFIVMLTAKWTVACTGILAMVLVGISTRHKSPPLFSITSALIGSTATSINVVGSRHTLWFANGVAYIEIPLWVSPACAIAAHGALDIFYATTLVDLRKCVLP